MQTSKIGASAENAVRYSRKSRSLGFGASAADDLLALAEAEARLLLAERLPQLLQVCVQLLDLALDTGVESLGEALPQLLALLRDALDLCMDLVRCHAI